MSDCTDPSACPLCGGPTACASPEGAACSCPTTAVSRELEALLAQEDAEGSCLCPRCRAGRVPSPCVGVCRLDAEGVACAGCLRTLDEVRRWQRMAPVERARVVLRVRREGAPRRPEDAAVG